MDTRHTRIFRRDARLSRLIAALRLLAIEPAIPRRRALLSDAVDAPRLPQNPCATGIEAVDLTFRCQRDEADHGTFVLGDQDSIVPEAPLPEGVRVDPQRPGVYLRRNSVAGVHPMHRLEIEAGDLRDVRPLDRTDLHQQVRCRAATIRAHSRCRRLNSATASPVFSTRTSTPALRRAWSVSSGTCMRPS